MGHKIMRGNPNAEVLLGAVKDLLKRNADPDAESLAGKTPCMMAGQCSVEVIGELISASKRHPLDVALRIGREDVVKDVLQNRMQRVTGSDDWQNTSLQMVLQTH